MTQPQATAPSNQVATHARLALCTALTAWLLAPALALAAEPAAEPTATASPAQATPAVETVEWRHRQQPLTTEEWDREFQHQQPEIGLGTRQWLQAQGNREQASANRPTLSGPALRRVNNRYLKTFEVEIPQQLRDSVPSNK